MTTTRTSLSLGFFLAPNPSQKNLRPSPAILRHFSAPISAQKINEHLIVSQMLQY
jgi:hypothetical protein